MKKPFFSIVTITYNAEEIVEKTIKSVINQTCKDYEYILVDGLSSDGTMNIVNKYKEYFSTIVSEKDEGIYDAMNKGLNLARGKYILFINANDEISGNFVLENIKNEAKGENYDVIYGKAKLLYEGERRYAVRDIQFSEKNIRLGYMPCHQSTYISVTRMKELGGFDTNYKLAADFDILSRVIKENPKILHIRDFLSNYMRGGSSTKNMEKGSIEVYKIIKKHFGIKYAILFKLRKQIFEEGRKKIFKFLGVDKFIRKVFLLTINKIK